MHATKQRGGGRSKDESGSAYSWCKRWRPRTAALPCPLSVMLVPTLEEQGSQEEEEEEEETNES